jgi:hypothetical protein
MVWHEGRDALVQVLLPVHPFGDRLDDEVAAAQEVQARVVVRRDDAIGEGLVGQWGGAQLCEVRDGLRGDAVRVAFLRGEVEQHRVDARIGEVRGDLRAHHPSAEHGGAAHQQILRHVS